MQSEVYQGMYIYFENLVQGLSLYSVDLPLRDNKCDFSNHFESRSARLQHLHSTYQIAWENPIYGSPNNLTTDCNGLYSVICYAAEIHSTWYVEVIGVGIVVSSV